MGQTKFRAQQTVDSAGVERHRTFADTKNEGGKTLPFKKDCHKGKDVTLIT